MESRPHTFLGELPRSGSADARSLPDAFDYFDAIVSGLGECRPYVFLDYDGTLTLIADRPEDAVLDQEMRQVLSALANCLPVAVVSGRDTKDVAQRIGLPGITYAGSHGSQILKPGGDLIDCDGVARFSPALDQAERELTERIVGIEGAQLERKAYAIAVHYRRVNPESVQAVAAAVRQVLAGLPNLRETAGRKVFELRPDIDWDKGKAVYWLMDGAVEEENGVCPIFIGDDVTDEDAFAAIRDSGIGILVEPREHATAARFMLRNPKEVAAFLTRLVDTFCP